VTLLKVEHATRKLTRNFSLYDDIIYLNEAEVI